MLVLQDLVLCNQILNLLRHRVVIVQQQVALILHGPDLVHQERGSLALFALILQLSQAMVRVTQVTLRGTNSSLKLILLVLQLLGHAVHTLLHLNILLQKSVPFALAVAFSALMLSHKTSQADKLLRLRLQQTLEVRLARV